MCRSAVKDGVRIIVATPRWDEQAAEPPLSFGECAEKLSSLEREMQGALSLKTGFMMKFCADLPELLDQYGSRLTLGGGRYLLVSLPALIAPIEVEDVWREITRRNYSVLIARPECNPGIRRDPGRLEQWVKAGALLQLDGASVTGAYGREVQRFSLQLIAKYGESLVVASNARRLHTRNISLSLARREITRKIGKAYARKLVSEKPAEILSLESKTHSASLRLTGLFRFSRGLRQPRTLTH